MMRSVPVIILLALAAQAHVTELIANRSKFVQGSLNVFVDELVDKLVNQAMRVRPIHSASGCFRHRMTLGKQWHLATPSCISYIHGGIPSNRWADLHSIHSPHWPGQPERRGQILKSGSTDVAEKKDARQWSGFFPDANDKPPGAETFMARPNFASASNVADSAAGAQEELEKNIKPILDRNPVMVARRVAQVLGTFTKVAAVWSTGSSERGKTLRNAIADLGPVFIKFGQTLAQRADLVGDETASALKSLQDRVDPFPTDAAYRIIREELKWDGPIVDSEGTGALFKEMSAEPVAAASLGQVYRCKLHDGREVAVKVQRPDVYLQVGLDLYVLRAVLASLKAYWESDKDYVEIADEVGAGLFRELDYRLEAANADRFAELHAFLPFLHVPHNVPEYTRARVMTTEWAHGRPLRDLSDDEKLHLVRMGVECTVAQLLRTGMLHADPHEGNFMLGDDGRLIMLDFGLVTYIDPANQESMAQAILNFMNKDYMGMLTAFVGMGVLPDQPLKWSRTQQGKWVANPTSWETLKTAFQNAIEDGGKKEDVKADVNNFGDLFAKLGGLAWEYSFFTPVYYVLVMRSLVTLEGVAKTTDSEFNMYTSALPYAARRALAPTTSAGAAALQAALLDENGMLRVDQLQTVAAGATPQNSLTELPAIKKVKETNVLKGLFNKVRRRRQKVENAQKESMDTGAATDMMAQLLFETVEGRALRRVLHSVNTLAAVQYLLSPAAKAIRNTMAAIAISSLTVFADRQRDGVVSGTSGVKSDTSDAKQGFGDTAVRKTLKPAAWRRPKVMQVLLLGHMMRLWSKFGLAGKIATLRLTLSFSWMLAIRALWQVIGLAFARMFPAPKAAQRS